MARHLTTPTHTRSTKVRAILALGLLIGIGATLTFAQWTDRTHVEAELKTDEFNVLVSTDKGETWVEANSTDGAAELDFGSSGATLEPGETIYSPVHLKTEDGSLAATVRFGKAQLAGDMDLLESMTYTVAQADECSLTGMDYATVIAKDVAMGFNPPAHTIGVGGNGAVTKLCVTVDFPESADTSLAGKAGTAQWAFTAESVTSS